MKKADTLADFIHAWTFDERPVYRDLGLRIVDKSHVWKRIQQSGKRYLREAIVKAERFVLDDEFITRAVERASTSSVSKLLTTCDLARLPYDRILVEFSDDAKFAAQKALDTVAASTLNLKEGETLGRAGFLFERFADNLTSGETWTAIHLSDSEGSIPVWPANLVLSPADDDLVDTMCRHPMSSQMMSSGWGLLSPDDNFRSNGLPFALHRELMQRGYAFFDPYFMQPLQKLARFLEEEQNKPALAEWLYERMPVFAMENAGTLRLACAILASLNVVPTTMVRRAVSGTYPHRLRNVPRLSTTTVKIDARPGHTRTVYEKSFRAATHHNRRHEVRGHWRDIERAGVNGCGHEPGDVDGNYALCKTCGHLLRWIDHHERGDEKLGWVIHDHYSVQ